MSQKLILTRNVTNKECPWLSKPYKKGTIVYKFYGCTYGCIADGIACSEEKDENPFFELPENAVREF